MGQNNIKHFVTILLRLGLLLLVAFTGVRLGSATAYHFAAPQSELATKGLEETQFSESWRFDSEIAIQGGTLDGVAWIEGQGLVAVGGGSTEDGSGTYLSSTFIAQTPVQAMVAEWVPGATVVEPVQLALRWQTEDGSWSEWENINEDHEMPPLDGQISTPVLVPGATTLQWRLALPPRQSVGRVMLGAVAVEAGPSSDEIGILAAPLPNGGPVVIPRSEWGGPASVPWDPEPSQPRAIVVHHTATSTGGNNPAAVVRAIDVYHRVTRDWGDIGYHYLIDHQGRIYAGRMGGPESVGAHAYDFNNGTVGIALIGTFDKEPITPAARNSLIALITWLSKEYRINPQGTTTFYDRPYATIMGHRHTGRKTTCPGDRIVTELPQLRQLVAQRLAGVVPPYPPGIELAPATEWVRGTVTASLIPQDAAPTQYSLQLDGAEIGTGNATFQVSVDTTTLTDGEHQLTAVARQNALSSQSEKPLRVDNRPPSVTLANSPTTDNATATLADAASGIAQASVRRRDASGTWGAWTAIEGAYPTSSLDSTVRFEGATALQWQATDVAGNVVESNEVEISTSPQLEVEGVELFPTSPVADEPFAVQVTLVNRANQATREESVVTVQFAEGQVLRWRIAPGLEAGATVLLRNSDRNVLPDSSFRGTLLAGTYQMEASVQSMNASTRWGPRELIVQQAALWQIWLNIILDSQTATP